MKKFIVLILCITMLVSCFSTFSLATGINNVPIIILKMDDYTATSSSIENFDKMFEILKEEDIKASFGVIGKYTEVNADNNVTQKDLEAFWENTKKYLDYGIQFWHHGYTHAMNEFTSGITLNEAELNFRKTLDLFKENTGVDITCFGSPGNALSEEYFTMISDEFPQIKSMFKSSDISESTDDVFVMKNRLDAEGGPGDISFEFFKTNYNSFLGQDYAFVQLHAGGYTDAEREEFKKIIGFLKAKGTVFMTPDEYLERRKLAITNIRVMDSGQLKYTIEGTQLEENSSNLLVEVKSADNGEVIYTDSFTYDGTKDFTISSEMERESGKKYILCISITEDGSKIYSDEQVFIEAVSDSSPIIILKLDDLSLKSWKGRAAFRQMYNVIKEEDVNAAFGIIGSRAVSDSDPLETEWNEIKEWIDSGIEIWSHGYAHDTSGTSGSEFNGYYATAEEMENAFRATLDIVKANTGYDITCFGAPGNNTSSAAISMINEKFPQITSIFFPRNGTPNAVAMNNIFNSLDGASFTLENFRTTYNPAMDYAVIQLHPTTFYAYDSNNQVVTNYVSNFREVIQFLKEEGCTFMTPSQYVDYVRVTSSDEAAEITAVVKDNAVIDQNGLGGSIDLTIFSEKDSNANVVAAVFDGSTFLAASFTDVTLARGTNVETITLPTAKTPANDSYDVKFYLWEKATLTPLAQPVDETVTPAPKVWNGQAPTEADKPAYDEATATYSIANGNQLAWFAENAQSTDNAVLTNDIYLNSFFEADGVTFDADWYENGTEGANNWFNYRIGDATAYSGTFDGKGKTIYGLYINSNDGALGGMFKSINGGTVKDLNIAGACVLASRNYTTSTNPGASVLAYQLDNGTIDNVSVDGLIKATGKACGLVGSIVAKINTTSTVINCVSNVDIDLSQAQVQGAVTNLNGGTSSGVGGIIGFVAKKTGGNNCIINGNKNYGNINAPKSQIVAGILAHAGNTAAVSSFANNENHGIIVGGADFVGTDSTKTAYCAQLVALSLSTYVPSAGSIAWNDGDNGNVAAGRATGLVTYTPTTEE